MEQIMKANKIWHDAKEKPERENLLIETNDGRVIHRDFINNHGIVKRWAYLDDLFNLQEEPLSEDLEKEINNSMPHRYCWSGDGEAVYSREQMTEFARHIARWQKQKDNIPASEDLEEAARNYAFVPYPEIHYDVKKQGSFIAGGLWKEQQFEKNRLAACDRQTKEEAKLPSKTLDDTSEELKKELDLYLQENFTIEKDVLNKFKIKEEDYMYSMDKSDILKMLNHFIKKNKGDNI